VRIIALSACVVVASVLPAGCGGKSDAPAATAGSPTAKQSLDDLASLLKEVAEQKKRPPARQADLQQYEAVYLGATLGITRQDIVYVWGSGLTGGQAVIAYEKDAPTAGGYVLLQDGTVKTMTADEFKAAPKPAGATGKK
jgi:hypothetical protein